MGIFDDAIREHLELKRQIGADETELKELEDEAFGPAARPGDPDFPGSTSEEAAIEDGGGEAPGGAGAEVPDGETPVDAVVDAPTDEPALTPLDEVVAEPVDPPAELEGGEVAPPEVDDAASGVFDAEASEPDLPDADSSFSTAEREAIADQPTVFFEQAPPAELELGDLELDFDEEIEEVGGSLSEPLTDEQPLAVEEVFAEEPAEVAEPPHGVEPAPAEPEAPEPEPGASAEPEAEAPPSQSAEPVTSDEVAPPTEAAEPGTGEDDVLEETPEFLRDNPDDDELWFEQGEPKDFDF